MSNIPADLKYVASHEWVRDEGDGVVTVGVTFHAQELLGDIVYIELPAVGQVLAEGDGAGVVESVKAASDVYAPIAGEVLEVNADLESAPETVNADPYGAGWFFKLKLVNPADMASLLDAAAYEKEVG
ncbi:glycine cleavage system protein GcvH [Laribacter hongkongensis]|uniref:Glycine cleavage system H protein n=2 Tax=Laribacter hongkongensis TaxID=168471 RepID=GCSH_LARHH|nr:glycine cleavage system protein GcvH [Laribacter hongkongensis]C1DD72.1 RecName: Full=Glycine cleavage system H protein [Laribacter hongkongensis HLHK9]ACO75704.1 GcvH [Laribacter hongkongensis HLHK9]ASJ25570.1 glycine cleavage system protein H [Laribacter hongkongensis]MBE5528443.1 glycine cleavage system protein H [Laribacter hongkongensis]MCG8993033.1 glycine cleavage system protein GcvH [Laribacter hongkongensis]MCG8996159.1 glycine cleavage system protein GcvH [Laribacter hongkongensi